MISDWLRSRAGRTRLFAIATSAVRAFEEEDLPAKRDIVALIDTLRSRP
jgi:hypothetical protein